MKIKIYINDSNDNNAIKDWSDSYDSNDSSCGNMIIS